MCVGRILDREAPVEKLVSLQIGPRQLRLGIVFFRKETPGTKYHAVQPVFEEMNAENARAFLPNARAKKLSRAAECLVYSLTPSGVLAENHPKNRGYSGILRGQKCLRRGQKCLRRRFSRRSPVGEWSRGARSMPRVFSRGSRRQPAA